MGLIGKLYQPSTALLTDLYQITMSYGYWKNGLADHEAVFNLFFRKSPFKGSYAIAAGLEQAVELIKGLKFNQADLDYLASLTGNDGKALFETGFLDYLRDTPFEIDVDAIPEGTVAFPHEPLIRLKGPIIPCQLLETSLLTVINFQTLIATKSSRVCRACGDDLVLEFGLRRAQGIDGGISASRAAYIGGCHASSNVMAGRLLDIPIKGTHAHAWVMMFPEEIDSFEAYAAAMPNNCIFLVDTYDTLKGVEKAVEVGKELRENGHEMVGIRLDSGDMAELSIRARQILDENGFYEAKIVASDSLDELKIKKLKDRGAKIDIWGVGTNLVTARDQPALGGVYKLAAVKPPGGKWAPKIKLSNTPIKVSNPGMQQVRRFRDVDGSFVADMIYCENNPPDENPEMVSLMREGARRVFNEGFVYEDLLVPVIRKGKAVWKSPSLESIRKRCKEQLKYLDDKHKKLVDSELYPLGLEESLNTLKMKLIENAR